MPNAPNDRLSRVESRLEELSRALAGIERRLDELERRGSVPATTSPAPTVSTVPSAAPTAPVDSDLTVALSLVGRTLLALGGGYLLRAVTEAGAVPQATGVLIGFLYAAAFVYATYRAGAAGKTTSAAFHGASAALLGYPLLWESTVRLELLTPALSAVLVLAFSLASLFVARRFALLSAAWVNETAAAATALALMGGTRSVPPYAAVLVAIAAAVLWLGRENAWKPLSWLSAAVANLAVALVVVGGLAQPDRASPVGLLGVPLALFLVYVASLVRSSSVDGAPVERFPMVQAGIATVLGYGGAVALAREPLPIAIASAIGIVVAILGYRAAFRSGELDGSVRGWFLSSLSLVVLLLATGSLPGRATIWSALFLVTLAVGDRWGRLVPGVHGSVYLLAAAAASGLLGAAAHAFFAADVASWPRPEIMSLVVFAVSLAGYARGLAAPPPARPWYSLPAAIPLAIVLAGVGAGVLFLLGPIVSGAGDAAALAALRTAVLAATAVGLGWLAGRGQSAARWILYPLLVIGGIKLAIDFPRGRAETLFFALGCYGFALILAPRLARRNR